MKKILVAAVAAACVASPAAAFAGSSHNPDVCTGGYDTYQAAKSAYITANGRTWEYISGPYSFKTLDSQTQAYWVRIAQASVSEACRLPQSVKP